MPDTRITPTTAPAYLKKRVLRGLRHEKINPADLKNYELAFFCDNCVHYDKSHHLCTMGYSPAHTVSEQMAQYDLTGTMAFCRFCEID